MSQAIEQDLRFKTLPAAVVAERGVPTVRPDGEADGKSWDDYLEAVLRLPELRGELDVLRLSLSTLGAGAEVGAVADLLAREQAVEWLINLCETRMRRIAEGLRSRDTRVVRPEDRQAQRAGLEITTRRLRFEEAMRGLPEAIEAARFYVSGAGGGVQREWGLWEWRLHRRQLALLQEAQRTGGVAVEDVKRPRALARVVMLGERLELWERNPVVFGLGRQAAESERTGLVGRFNFTAEEIAAEREVLSGMK